MQTTYDKQSVGTRRRDWAWRWVAQAFATTWERPLCSAFMALCIYALIAQQRGPLLRLTAYPYFNYLADAFLHGQTWLRLTPRHTRDLSLFAGHLYLYWPPFPAVVLMPFVALFGVTFSDVLATLLMGSLNVALVAQLLRQATLRGMIELSGARRGLLVLFFALGTVHVTLAPYGLVWFFGQLVGFACVVLGYLAALRYRNAGAFLLAGLAFACAMLTRNHLVLAGLWPAWYLLHRHRNAPWRQLALFVGLGVTPVLIALTMLGWYNWLRFGDAFDNGLTYHQMATQFAADYARYGAFNLHYLPTNLFYQLVAYPFPFRRSSTLGGSLFLLSPVFFAALAGLVDRRSRPSSWMLGATILLVAAPIFLLMGTGWVQWGPRYTLDYTAPLLLLTALGARRWPAWLLAALTAISVLHYIVGALYLARFV